MRLQKKIPNLWRCVFFDSAQTVTASRQNALHYDGSASGQIIYAYVGGNPLRWVDPRGLVPNPAEGACALGPNPVCVGGVAADVITSAIALAMASSAWIDNPEAAKEHDAYKKRAGQPPPPNLDECERLKWLLQREQDVVNAMEQWDSKWIAGRHIASIQQRNSAIEKLKKQIEEKCGKCKK